MCAFLLAAIALTGPAPVNAQNPPGVKHVLLLLPQDPSRPGILTGIRGLSDELQKTGSETVSVHTETFVPKPGFEAQARKTITEKYARTPLQAIVVVFSPLAGVAAELREQFWRGIPMICVVASAETSFVPPPDSTEIVLASDLKGTVQAAFDLFPNAKRLVIAGGAAKPDRAVNLAAVEAAKALKPAAEIIDLGGLSATEMKDRVAATPSDSIILLTGFTVDGRMQEVTDPQMVNLLAPVAAAPMFDLTEHSLGFGVVGGSVGRNAVAGSEIGKILLRLLHGETPAAIPPVRVAPKLILDWRQLRRFGVPDDRIPQSAELYYRQPTLWGGHRNLIVGTGLAILFQALVILILFAERRTRRESQRKLAERLHYEHIVSEISAGFASLPSHRMDEQIVESLRRLTEFLEAERTTLWRCRPRSNNLESIRSWAMPQAGAPVPPGLILGTELTGTILAGQVANVSATTLPEGSVERAALEQAGIRSALMIPLSTGGRLIGALSCTTFTRTHIWPETQIQSIQTLGELFANALALRESEEATRQGEALNAAVMASLPGYVAIVDREGMILKANEAWARDASGLQAGLLSAQPGQNYLDVCREAAKTNAALSQVSGLVASVLTGERPNLTTEVSQTVTSGEQWLEVRVEPLEQEMGGAVLALVDITARKRAEVHAARNLETISHLNRVAAVSELATSLAHELNQPLAAIGLNAEAAIMQLERPAPETAGVREAMCEILSDQLRAGEVIRRMRDLLKKKDRVTEPTNVNEMAKRIVPLVRNDAALRHVNVRLELAPDPPAVASDRVQLQQVILNLVTNAMDAMSEAPAESRVLTIRTLHDTDQVMVEVEDCGPGIPEESLDSIFTSFYTTKPHGLGVGLAISRSIIEADGGRLWAENQPGGGARFRFSLPVLAAASSPQQQ